jgi:hypothetical protein
MVWWLSDLASMLILIILFVHHLHVLIKDRQRIQHDKYYYDWAHPVVPKMPIIFARRIHQTSKVFFRSAFAHLYAFAARAGFARLVQR